jgi:mRNA-degrading endonuclease RelE of RelBE toxin-antitoxin system
VKGGVQSSQVVSNSQFIAGKKYLYSDKSLKSAPASCITLVNAYGKMPTISVKDKTLLCDDDLFVRCGGIKSSSSRIDSNNAKKECISGTDSLNDRSIRVPFNSSLRTGVLLSNGSSYLLQKNGLILSYSFNEANTHEVSATIPTRISKKIATLPPNSTLYPCPEQDLKIQNYQNFFRGKQGSLFGVITTVHSGPADFAKLFLKSRDKRYKREKIKIEKKYERIEKPVEKPQTSSQSSINNNKEESERNSDKERMDKDCDSCSGSPGKSNKMSLFSSSVVKERSTTASSKQSAESAQSNMSEALRNLEERGEKLNRMNVQAEEMSEGAQQFRELIKLHKQELQKKATRWGL